MAHVYPNEPRLFRVMAALAGLFWLTLLVVTMGTLLIYLLIGLIGYLFVHSAFISYVRGSGVCLSTRQLPELHARFVECASRLGIEQLPEAYVLNGQGVFNALATRFLRRNYVVLYSDVLDALTDHPEALNFYIGHELGHSRRGHLTWAFFLMPCRALPILGAAYGRAREYTCDLHGLACCDDPEDAQRGLAVLAAGERSWSEVDLQGFARQSEHTGGFWMSYHELTGHYPWLTKRMRRLIAASSGGDAGFPRRHGAAWVLAFFVPNFGAGGANSLVTLMVVVGVVGVLAAVAVPNFLRYQQLAAGEGADTEIWQEGEFAFPDDGDLQAAYPDDAPAAPAAESQRAGDWLRGRWTPLGAGDEPPLTLQFSAGNSVVVRFQGGGTLLGTYTVAGQELMLRLSSADGMQDFRFEVAPDGSWLRSTADGMTFERTG